MRQYISAPDGTARQDLRNAIGQIEGEYDHLRQALKEITSEFEFLKEENVVERLAEGRLQVGQWGVRLEAVIPKLQTILDGIHELVGPKVMERAAQPPQFQL